MWKTIDGYRYLYRINEKAEVQRQRKDGTWKSIATVSHRGHNGYVYATVALAKFPNGFRQVMVSSLMEGRFLPARKQGEIYIRKNTSKDEFGVENMTVGTKSDLCRRMYMSRCKRVLKVDEIGNVLEAYPSCAEAARRNYISASAVQSRCNNRVAKPLLSLGFTFQFEGAGN